MTDEEKQKRAKERRQIYYNRLHKIIDETIYKWCKHGKHWVLMNEDNFYNNSSNGMDGLSPNCKNCDKEKSIKYNAQNREKHRAISKKNYEENKEYKKSKHMEWLKQNKEKWKEYRRQYLIKNKDKLKIYAQRHQSHKINDYEWYECRRFFNFRCACCGITWEEQYDKYKEDFHRDHLYHNGRNDLKNCIPLCTSCNTSKHQFTINEWYNNSNPNYTYKRYYRIYLWIRYECKKYLQKKKNNNKYNKVG